MAILTAEVRGGREAIIDHRVEGIRLQDSGIVGPIQRMRQRKMTSQVGLVLCRVCQSQADSM